MNKYADYVLSKLDKRTLLEQLAEECAELSKASLKRIRAYGMSDNVTPISKHEAYINLYEELQDVISVAVLVCGYASVLDIVINIDKYPKYERWAKRLGCKEAKTDE